MTPAKKIALVTGAGSGIGRAVSLALHGAGFSVVLAGRTQTRLDETASLGASGQMIPVATDITQPESVKALFGRTREMFGRLDVLFNNAGANVPAVPLEELDIEKWRYVIDVNLTGSFLCAREAIRLMKSQDPRGGRIINNGSLSAHVPRPRAAAYTASKHAITGLTKSLALDCREYDIACGQIDIGNAHTDMTQRMTSGVIQADGSMKVEPRMDVQLVADAVLYMANLPLDANVPFITVMATKMPFGGRG